MSDFPHLSESAESIWGDLRWPSWLEVGMIVCIIAILLALQIPPINHSAEIQAEVEEKVAHYNEASIATVIPDSRIRIARFDASGDWRRGYRRRGSFVSIEKIEERLYRAEFSSGCCSGGCRLPRHATFSGGVLLLEQPAAEFRTGNPFRRLYAVRVGESHFLVPEGCVAEFEKGLSDDRTKIVDKALIQQNSYRREGTLD